jgi:hypothetical protein
MGAVSAAPEPAPSSSFSRTTAVWQVLVCIGLPAVLCAVLFHARHDRLSSIAVMSSPPVALPGLLWDVPSIQRDAQGRYMVAGWVADRFDVRWLKPRVVVVPQQQMHGVEIRTRAVVREDVRAAMEDGRIVSYSGFQAYLRTQDFPAAAGARIYLSVEREGQRVLVDIGKTLPQDGDGQKP